VRCIASRHGRHHCASLLSPALANTAVRCAARLNGRATYAGALTTEEAQVQDALKLCKNFRPEGWDATKVLEEVKQKKTADAAKKDKPQKPAGSR
jgi:hypothetical protein